jgi:hypothetical protein
MALSVPRGESRGPARSKPRFEEITMTHDLLRTFAQSGRHVEPAGHTELRRLEDQMTLQKTDPNAQSQKRRDQEIDGRYGAIGIAAVAAAVRYQSIAPTKTTAPTSRRHDEDWPDQAA